MGGEGEGRLFIIHLSVIIHLSSIEGGRCVAGDKISYSCCKSCDSRNQLDAGKGKVSGAVVKSAIPIRELFANDIY